MTFITTENLLQEKSPFMGCESSKQLRKLSYEPIDLSRPDQLTPERLAKYFGEACGYKLLYGTEKVTDQVMDALHELSKEMKAIEKMKRMQEGEVVNFVKPYPSENRPALHTATRDFFDHPRQTPKAKEAALLARRECDKLKSFMAKLEVEKKFDDMIVIGIGGSELGPRANYEALIHLLISGRRVFHFQCRS